MNAAKENDLPQSLLETGSHLYEDGICIIYQYQDVKKMSNVLSKEFSSFCRLFIDKQLSIHFWEDETNSMLFSKTKSLNEINISFTGYFIIEDGAVEHVGSQLHSKLSGKAMT